MRHNTYLAPFRHRGFAPLYLAFLVSRLGDWAYLVGFSLWLLDLTRSPLVIATVTAMETIPRVALGAVAGTLADRHDRVGLMLACDLLRALLILPLLLVRGMASVWVVYLVAFGLTALSAQFSVARNPLLATIVPQDDLLKGNALFSATDSVVMILGPAAASWAIARYGYTAAFAANAASFLLSALLVASLLRLPIRRATTEAAAGREPSFGAATAATFALVKTPGRFRQVLLVVGLLALGQGAVQALHTPLVIQVFHATKEQYAAILALQGVGGVIGAYIIIRLSERVAPHVLLGAGLAFSAVTTALYTAVPVYWLLVLVTVLEGISFTGVLVAIPTLVQRLTPDHLLGRAFGAVDSVENGSMLLAMGASGVLASITSVRAVFAAVACLLAGAAWTGLTTLGKRGQPQE